MRIEDVARTMGILFCSVDMKFASCLDISFSCSLLEIIMFIMNPSPSKTMLYLMMLCPNTTIMTPTPFESKPGGREMIHENTERRN